MRNSVATLFPPSLRSPHAISPVASLAPRYFPVASLAPSEVALSLAVFHACLGDPVVGAGGTALGQPGDSGLGDHLGHGGGVRLHATGAGDVADGAEPHGLLDDLFVLARLQVFVHREQHAVALENLALVRVIDR